LKILENKCFQLKNNWKFEKNSKFGKKLKIWEKIQSLRKNSKFEKKIQSLRKKLKIREKIQNLRKKNSKFDKKIDFPVVLKNGVNPAVCAAAVARYDDNGRLLE